MSVRVAVLSSIYGFLTCSSLAEKYASCPSHVCPSLYRTSIIPLSEAKSFLKAEERGEMEKEEERGTQSHGRKIELKTTWCMHVGTI